jgi:hypothetical protein
VLPGPGKHPPQGSAAPGLFLPATGHTPGLFVGDGLGDVGGVLLVLVDGLGLGELDGEVLGLGLGLVDGEVVGLGEACGSQSRMKPPFALPVWVQVKPGAPSAAAAA